MRRELTVFFYFLRPFHKKRNEKEATSKYVSRVAGLPPIKTSAYISDYNSEVLNLSFI
jgi:hypothetical protein